MRFLKKFERNLLLTSLFILNIPLQSMALELRDSIAYNRFTVDPAMEEACEEAKFYLPARILVEKEGRLKGEFREAARRADPISNLATAAIYYAKNDPVRGNAYADFSVTGKESLKRFQGLFQAGLLTESTLLHKVETIELSHGLNSSRLAAGTNRALDRAFRVLHILSSGNDHDNARAREELGYIAISGEDDQPHRPVNVPSTSYPQYNLDVAVNGINVRTRFIVAETSGEPQRLPRETGRTLPVLPKLQISDDAKIIIYIHGMDSRLEEAMDLFNSLKRIGKQTGENWTIISFDMPTSGYADKLLHHSISGLEELGSPRSFPPGFNARGRHNVPVLDFLENYIVAFVNKLDNEIPIKNKIKAVIGGSMGGNLTFRLGRRNDLPWLKNVVTWSPASIWKGLADGADIFKQMGVATAWRRAGGDARNLVETADKREKFFEDAFNGAINIGFFNIVPAQPDQWWRRGWQCFANSRALARVDRHEIYNRNFRLWHWRLGGEQLIFSQLGSPEHRRPLYLDNNIRMLLACGKNDNFNYTNICNATEKAAEEMVNTPGLAIFLEDTGHSIHNERPNYFANEIVQFLR